MVVNTNIEAQRTAGNLSVSHTNLSKSLSRLSSGNKIITPSDDATGLAVSLRMSSTIHRLEAVMTNISTAVSYVQTQDGYANNIEQALIRMSELTVLSQDITKIGKDRDLYDKEFQQLKAHIRSSFDKSFNGVPLFGNGSKNVILDAYASTDKDGSSDVFSCKIPAINIEDDVYSNIISEN